MSTRDRPAGKVSSIRENQYLVRKTRDQPAGWLASTKPMPPWLSPLGRSLSLLLVVATLHPAVPTFCPGNYLLQAAVDEGCTQIGGNLVIALVPHRNLTALAAVQEISGSLLVYGNEHLQSLDGLQGLQYINGSVDISGNGALLRGQGFQLCAATIGGSFRLVIEGEDGIEYTSRSFCFYSTSFNSKTELQAAVDAYIASQDPGLGDIANWNVENVTDLSFLFCSCSLAELCYWKLGLCNNLDDAEEAAFYQNSGCNEARSGFNFDISAWHVARVTSLSGLLLCQESYDQPLNDWDTSRVTDTSWLFANAKNFDQPLDLWDTSRVVNANSMFNGAEVFNRPLAAWNLVSLTYARHLFRDAKLFDQPLASWNMLQLVDGIGMFDGAQKFNRATRTQKRIAFPQAHAHIDQSIPTMRARGATAAVARGLC
jgi:hypothetical protein